MLHSKPILSPEKNGRVPVLTFADLARPKYFHEIARFRLVKIIKILAKPQLVKKTCSAWSVCVPSAPDPFAIVLISNDELLQSGKIEMKLSPRAQGLNGPDEHEVSCA